MRKGLLTIAALTAALATGLVLAAVATAQGGNRLAAQLRGANEVPAAPASNRGQVEITLKPAAGKVCWEFTIAKIDGRGMAAHIHKGKAGVSGPVLVTLCGPCKSPVVKTVTVTSAQRDVIEHKATYVNVHTAKNGGGEIRGQVKATE